MEPNSKLSLNDICAGLGLQPQFLLDLAEVASSQYSTFDRPKKSGGYRTTSVPKNALKRIQRHLLDGFLASFQMPPYVHGCVKGRSILSNARDHVNKPLIINIDLTNFFGTINLEMVTNIFRETFNCDDDAAKTFGALTTYGNFLPQGAPTSPVLANIAALIR
jgi:Reverse transcriptase (RNA-dependent DNA polymerase).